MRSLLLLILVLFALNIPRCSSTPPPPQFEIVDLTGMSTRFRHSTAVGLNDAGEVAGYWYDPVNPNDADSRAFYWRTGSSSPQEIPPLGSSGSSNKAYGICQHPILNPQLTAVVGSSQTDSADWHAFKWDPSEPGASIDLDRSAPGTSHTTALNAVFVILRLIPTAELHAVGTQELNGITRGAGFFLGAGVDHISTISDVASSANSINASQQVVGRDDIGGGLFHAYIQDYIRDTAAGHHDVGTLPGANPSRSEAFDVNNAGNIVGYSYTSSGLRHAFLYVNRVWFDLGALPGGANSEARALSDVTAPAKIVGFSEYQSGGNLHHAVLWWGIDAYDLNGNRPDGTPFIRNNPSDPGGHWELIEAYNINSNNWIVGLGRKGSEERAFLLRPR
jgi:probable HAF family extracellular repeat protein